MDTDRSRTQILTRHLHQPNPPPPPSSYVQPSQCLDYSPPELSEPFAFDTKSMRGLLDSRQQIEVMDYMFGLMMQNELFRPGERGGKVYLLPDYDAPADSQREATKKRAEYLAGRGTYQGWFRRIGNDELKNLAFADVVSVYDYSLAITLGVHLFLWGGAIKFLGTKRHHDKWLKDTEDFAIKGCFAMTELGHGSNVQCLETITRYDSRTGEFVINTPCESAQKYWIGGAVNHATHTVVFSQLEINGTDKGVHAFIAQIRDSDGHVCPNVRIAECSHKIGLNGVDNGRIWFDNLRVPRENLLNSVADVSPDGQYISAIRNPNQRFTAFMAPLTSGRVVIASGAVYSSKIGLAIAIRYSLTRRAFSLEPGGPEVLLDHPSHQWRLLTLLAKTYAMSFAVNYLKSMYVKRTPESMKAIHIVSSAFKATLTWHNMRTLQECREACGVQGLKTENRVGHLKGDFDVQLTFEGDNNVLMQQVSKALLAELVAARKRNRPVRGLGLEHINESSPAIPLELTSSTLRTIQFQINIFCLRERDLLNRFAAEVTRRVSRGESKENVFNESYQLAEDLGRAFSDRAILQAFIDVEGGNASSGPLKSILSLLRSMYALTVLDEDAAFLRYGYLSTANAVAVRTEVAKLCRELRPHALALVSSFGIPDAFLSPIAFNWVDTNSWPSVRQSAAVNPWT